MQTLETRSAAQPTLASSLTNMTPRATLVWRSIEFTAIFVAAPVAYVLWGLGKVKPIPILIVLTLFAFLWLRRKADFDRGELSWRRLRASSAGLRGIFLRAALAFAILIVLVSVFAPDKLFNLPRERPLLWLFVMVAYPLFSVLPQELVWRNFMAHRYEGFLKTPLAFVAASALTFGFVHIIFLHWIPVAMTIVGGVLFSLTYLRTRSLWVCSLEHALYGCMLFTVGLGEYFYHGAAVARAAGG